MMDQPELWQVKGNEVMEQVTDWQSANQAALQSRSPQRINAAVSEFVQKNPDERAALFLLLTRYDRSADPAGYQKLLKFFTDEDMIEQMQFACLEPSDADLTELPARQQQRIRQVLEADSIAAANPPSAEQLLAAQDSLEALQSESPQR